MRTLAALVLYVSLVYAGDWETNSRDGVAAVSREDYQAAETFFRESWKLAHTARESLITAGNMAVILHRSGRNREAIEWLERSYRPSKDPVTASQLAMLYRFTGDYAQAEHVAREALSDSPQDPQTKATLLNTLADILREELREGESRSLFEEARHVRGAPWTNQIESLTGLANLDRDMAKWQAAIQLARDHNDKNLEAVALRGMGESWIALKNPARAEPLFRQALAIFEAGPEAGGHQTASTLTDLADLYIRDDKAAMAEDALLRAVSIEERVLGPDHPQIAMMLQMLGDTAARLNRPGLSKEYLDRAALIMRARFGDNSPMLGAVFVNRGIIEQRSGHPAEAAGAYDKGLAILASSGPEMEAMRISAMERYAEVLKDTHRGQEAKALLARVKSFRGK